MKTVFVFSVIACAMTGLGGCATFTPAAGSEKLTANSSYWLNYDSTRRGAWVSINSAGKISSCSEPAPDVAQSLASSLKGKFTLGEATAEGVDISQTLTALELAGRDNVVLLAREGLFRICEQAQNGNIPPDKVGPLLNDVFQQTKEIAIAQARKAEANAAATRNELQLRNLSPSSPAVLPDTTTPNQ